MKVCPWRALGSVAKAASDTSIPHGLGSGGIFNYRSLNTTATFNDVDEQYGTPPEMQR